jgi:hypothetical protein
MPRDRNGADLAVGDQVALTYEVVEVFEGSTTSKVSLRPVAEDDLPWLVCPPGAVAKVPPGEAGNPGSAAPTPQPL